MDDVFKTMNRIWKNNHLDKFFVHLRVLSDNKFDSPKIIYKNLVNREIKNGTILIVPFCYQWNYIFDAKDNQIIELYIENMKYTFNYGNATIESLETFENKDYFKYTFSKNVVKADGRHNGRKIVNEFNTSVDIHSYLFPK